MSDSPEKVTAQLHYAYCSGNVWNERNPMITTPKMADFIAKELEADHAKGICWRSK